MLFPHLDDDPFEIDESSCKSHFVQSGKTLGLGTCDQNLVRGPRDRERERLTGTLALGEQDTGEKLLSPASFELQHRGRPGKNDGQSTTPHSARFCT